MRISEATENVSSASGIMDRLDSADPVLGFHVVRDERRLVTDASWTEYMYVMWEVWISRERKIIVNWNLLVNNNK